MELNERFKLLSNYNVKNTLTENVVSILNEDAFTKAAREGALVAKELEGALKSMKADSKIAKELETLKAGGVQTADDLLSMLKLNKLSAEAKGLMNSSILKSGTGNAKMLELAAQDLVKSPAFANKYYKSFVEGGRPGLENALKQSGKYSEGAITKIVSQAEKNMATLEKMSKVKLSSNISKDVAKATEEVAAATGKSQKEIKQLVKQDTFFSRKKEYFTKLYNKLKSKGISKETLQRWKSRAFLNKNGKISWKKVALWAVAIGISYNVLKDMLNKGGVFIDDTDTGGGSGGGTGGSGGGTGGSTFKDCTDFPYKKGCSSSVVSEVQKCLGLSDDGKFGSKTEKALTDGGYGTEITKEVYDKIKEKCGTGGTGGTTTTTTLPAPEFQDVEAIPSQMTW